ncbi:hypothetical protein Taro_036909 [Colocasia esculenta]|uniref:Uncharacterized protein n=1 Tax=Colocasia esculenta TaxID=4460 RepID=A0A843WHP0_COLES|nr:hypothetical protein [Colocasia esculenta]
MSSPARSSASATSVGAQGGGGGAGSSSTAGFGDDASTCHFPRDLVTPQDHKDEALVVLKAELMAALDKEVKSLDRDSWMFAGPRSQIHLISRPGNAVVVSIHQWRISEEANQRVNIDAQAPSSPLGNCNSGSKCEDLSESLVQE